MRFTIFKAIPVVAFLLAACGPSGNTVAVPGGTVTTSSDGSTTTVTGPNGEVATLGAGSANAAVLPDFMPLYPGATVMTSISGGNPTQKTVSVVFETQSPPADIIAFYKGKATELGLAETLNAADGDSMTYMAVKDQRSIIVVASKSQSSTEAQITWAAPPGG